MKESGPQIDALTHRLAECPPDFLETPGNTQMNRGSTPSAVIDVGAIACDLMRQMGVEDPASLATSIHRFGMKRQQLISITVWLLSDSWFVKRKEYASAIGKLLVSEDFEELVQIVRPEQVIGDPDRREELARICLRELQLRPKGESETEAKDRLTTLDSVERERVVRKTRAAEARARQIREKMAEQAAQEAAARYSRE